MSGSGGGGGGGGGNIYKPAIKVLEDGIRYFEYAKPNNMKIQFYCSSLLPDPNNKITSVKYYFGKQVREDRKGYSFGEENIIEFDIGKELQYFSTSTTNTLTIQVTDSYDNVSSPK